VHFLAFYLLSSTSVDRAFQLNSSVSLPPNQSAFRRRLSQDVDKIFGGNSLTVDELQIRKLDAKSSIDNNESKPAKVFYPFNISGTYLGYGWVNYTDRATRVASSIWTRTHVISEDDRYHVAQIRSLLVPTGEVVFNRDKQPSATHEQTLLIESSGIYDSFMGRMEALTNSPSSIANLPLFRESNLTWYESDWPISGTGVRKTSKCQFLINVLPNSVTEKAAQKEQAGREKMEKKGVLSSFLDREREYIDIHLRATILNLNTTCHNMTQASVDVDLLRYDIFVMKGRRYAILATFLSLLQLIILSRHLQYCTPLTSASKLSLGSIAIHSVFDAYVCFVHLIIGLYEDNLFNSFIMVSFLQFIMFSMFDLRLVLLVWKGRRPQDFNSGWDRMRSTLTKVYSCFYGGIFCSLVIFYYLKHWMKYLVFLQFSFWIPQIVQNVLSGQRFAVQDRYLYGITATRLFFPLYAFGCPENFFELQTNYFVVAGLLVFCVVQVFMLKGQDKWGSRFFIMKRFWPNYYEYHQTFKIDLDDDENCAICMTKFGSDENDEPDEEDVDPKHILAGNVTVTLSRDVTKDVLTTPCDHHFCRDCLTRWMETKMICPTCRQSLPPYDVTRE